MTREVNDGPKGEPFSLRRWARRKLEAVRVEARSAAPSAAPAVSAGAPAAVAPAAVAPVPATVEPVLPPIESLTIDSDFTLFMQPQVDAAVRRAALKQLFRDPRFNVMDGLDTYIGDYTKADPIPESMLKQLAHARPIFDPPTTVLPPERYEVDAPAATAATGTAPAEDDSPATLQPGAEMSSKRHEGPTRDS